jgi:1,4-dihydroxy-6-naphthoate synthase
MIPVAISPCPNDTFLFHAWIEGLVGKDLPPQVTFGDIQHLNEWAESRKFPLIKLSIAKYAALQKEYELLPVGAALGWDCGPKLIAREGFSLENWKEARVAIPGRGTTAHHLQNHFLGDPREKVFCLYNEVEGLLMSGRVDAGVIIHETRFTHAFNEIGDFGRLWKERYDLPLPLGGIAIERGSPHKVEVISALRESLDYAWQNPEDSLSFVLQHAISKDEKVAKQHISLYVNQETYALSSKGQKAVDLLLQLCQ